MYRKDNYRDALIFLAPTLLIYLMFMIGPIIASFVLSFTDYDIISPIQFIGLKNIVKFLRSARLHGIYLTTFKLAIMLVALHTVIGLLLAVSVHSLKTKYQSPFRILIYFPCILTTASVAIAWFYLYHFEFGVLNYFLRLLHIKPIPWLLSRTWVYATIALFSVWKFVGIPFLYYYIGLQSIPKTLYEAAKIDGAGPVQTFFRITLPLLTPTIFFVMITLSIGATQIFDEPFFLTRGGPADASRTVNLYIYETAYQKFNLGYASTIALSLFVVLFAFTIIQLQLSKRWVHYDFES
ncbi:MAG: sugar ABC transporter permease [bacterium]|nr:sugar ABC transporter permease [bacterium]